MSLSHSVLEILGRFRKQDLDVYEQDLEMYELLI